MRALTLARIGRLPDAEPAISRLASLATLDAPALRALRVAATESVRIPARREILREGVPISQSRLIVSGWAARVRMLEDGRRQVMSLLLPGELICRCDHSKPLMVSTVTALSMVESCFAPSAEDFPALREAYAVSRAREEACLLAQITRLGRMSAEERMVDFFLEIFERLSPAGLILHNRFAMPITQEVLADALGLTPVHTNRTLQQLRRRGDIVLQGGWLTLSDPAALTRRVGRVALRLSG